MAPFTKCLINPSKKNWLDQGWYRILFKKYHELFESYDGHKCYIIGCSFYMIIHTDNRKAADFKTAKDNGKLQ